MSNNRPYCRLSFASALIASPIGYIPEIHSFDFSSKQGHGKSVRVGGANMRYVKAA